MRAVLFNKRARLLALQAVLDREQMIEKTTAFLEPIFAKWLTGAFNRFRQADCGFQTGRYRLQD